MGSLISILQTVGPLLAQLSNIVTAAIAANTTGDQATLDALHDEALALANSLKPADA